MLGNFQRDFAPWTIPAAIFVLCTPAICIAQEQEAILDLMVNMAARGQITVILRQADVLILVSDLEQAGVRGFTGQRETIAGFVYVSLSSLAPAVTYEVDETNLALRLRVGANLLGTTVLDFQTNRPPGLITSQDSSVFFNYAFNLQDFDAYSLFSEAGLSFNNNLLYSSFSRNTNGEFVRGLTNLSLDDREKLNRTVIGDTFASTGNLGSNLILGGVSFQRNFNLDPYFVRYPTLGLSGVVQTPSTLEIYTNNNRLRSVPIPPGVFDIRNLPVPAGTGEARVVIRDAFGREQDFNYPFYFSTALLKPGLSEYSLNLGFPRDNIGRDSFDYGSLAFLGRYRVGLTNSLTAGLRLETTSNLISGGPSLSFSLPFGNIDLDAAVSSQDGRSGAAASLAYSYLSRSFTVGTSVRAFSPEYATVDLQLTEDRPQLEANLLAGIPLGSRASVTLQYGYFDYRDRPSNSRISLFSNINLAPRANLLVLASRSFQSQGRNVDELSVGLSYSFGNNTSANLSQQLRNGEATTVAEIQKSIPQENGFGYRLRTEPSEGLDNINSRLEYQTDFGRYELNYDRRFNNNFTSLRAAGGVVAIGGSTFLTRPVDNSYAVVRVPGVPGVRVYLNNQETGTTDANGNLFVTRLIPYIANRLSIADEDIPLGYRVDATERLVAPAIRGGAVVSFPVQRIQNFTGFLIVVEADGKEVTPAYGEFQVTGNGVQASSPIGGKGEFYLENIPTGRYAAKVQYSNGACQFEVNIPESQQQFVNLDTLRCTITPNQRKAEVNEGLVGEENKN